MIDPLIKRKIDALCALVERGVGGEKENARRFLLELMDKHRLTADDLTSLDVEIRYIPFQTQYQKKLIFAIANKVLNRVEIHYYQRQGTKRLGFKLTKSQFIEMEYLYTLYKRAFQNEITTLLRAFIIKNKIWPDRDVDILDSPELTSEEEREFEKALALSKHVEKVQTRKMLNGKGQQEAKDEV